MRPTSWLGAVCLAWAALASAGAQAAYPEKPVNIVVGFAPGGTNDILARLIATELEKRLGQPFVVENKPGANSMISANYVKRAEPDGHTLLVIASGGLTVNPAVYAPGRVTYDPVRDFTPIAQLALYPMVVTTGPNLADVRTLPALLERARSDAKPLTHGVATSAFQLAAALMAADAGIEFTHIPYKGSGPVVTDLMGGQLDVAFLDAAAVTSQLGSGRLHALAVTTPQRSPALPDTPTVAESGLPGYDAALWAGLVAPAGTPAAVIERINAALADALASPALRERFEQLGMSPGTADSQTLAAAIQRDLARWTRVASDAGIRIE
ncbi:tripartite tricarboxylate transporter substrate binding protein [Verticiella sediminum]|uniref:Tripartite tricarboxylate transporter substrate binding protein n=1 Tax=Verticiella sediminum TaxID=1247510 RepID=A0A556AU11_9BURK|nr:tripartite tricarboxylate transporter substrate binding protein [Verticiella sediminum]TSH96434.1 tripartite tricarboxylate transporter substrate binding protein [Verticiella sediminum]